MRNLNLRVIVELSVVELTEIFPFFQLAAGSEVNLLYDELTNLLALPSSSLELNR